MKKIIALILTLVMIFSVISSAAVAVDFGKNKVTASLDFTIISDLHFYPESLMSDSKAWTDYCNSNVKMFPESEAIIRTAIETAMTRNPDLKYILVPGDLTKDGEYKSHTALVSILESYEKEYGVEFIVTTGNHDINQPYASSFATGKEEKETALQYDQFAEMYKNLGYDLAIDRYSENGTAITNGLSYAADLMDNDGNYSYRLIVIDSCRYGYKPEDAYKDTGGEVTPELMAWVKNLTEDAYENGKTPMVMLHHGLAAHMETEPSITSNFPLDNYMEVAETFASWGIHYAFTGHLHMDNTACVINDDGETLYDIQTASVTGYPCTYHEFKISTYKNGESDMEINSVAFDNDVAFSYGGKTYDKGTFGIAAFHQAYGGKFTKDGKADADEFLLAIVRNTISKYIVSIQQAGSIGEFLKTMNLDLEAILDSFLSPYIGNGIKVGGYNIFSVDNIMWFINDLLDQVYDLYIKDETKLYTLLYDIIHEVTSITVSDVPCTKYIEKYGFGDKNRPGTIGDLLLTILASWYAGNETIEDDLFIQDALKKIEEAYIIEELFNKIVDLLLHTLIEDNILSKLEIRVDKLLNDDCIGKNMGKGVNYLLSYVLKGDFTYMNLVDTIFMLGVLP